MSDRPEQKYTRLLNGQIVKDPNGQSLEHVATPALLRAHRSFYWPHVGEKQKSKQTPASSSNE